MKPTPPNYLLLAWREASDVPDVLARGDDQDEMERAYGRAFDDPANAEAWIQLVCTKLRRYRFSD